MQLIAVDPGSASGAMASRLTEGGPVKVYNMPKDLEGIIAWFRAFKEEGHWDLHVVMENVGGTMPGNAARAARTFATHIGHLEAIAMVFGWKVTKVAPQTWMKFVARKLGIELPKGLGNKKLRKAAIYEGVQKLYPDVKITKRQADALGIFCWAEYNLVPVGKKQEEVVR